MKRFDQTLGELLISNGLNAANILEPQIWELLDIESHDFGSTAQSILRINQIMLCDESKGCVFRMPVLKNQAYLASWGNAEYVISSRKTGKEIRKIIKMKAFL